MGFTYLDKFTYPNTIMMQVVQRCLDNRGPTVPKKHLSHNSPIHTAVFKLFPSVANPTCRLVIFYVNQSPYTLDTYQIHTKLCT